MKTTKTVQCFKCNGGGKIERFAHVDNGDCFQCGGYGELDVDVAAELAPRAAATAKRRELARVPSHVGEIGRLERDLDPGVPVVAHREENEQREGLLILVWDRVASKVLAFGEFIGGRLVWGV